MMKKIYCNDYSGDNPYSEILFIKRNHYLLLHPEIEWNDETLNKFVQTIHWQ